MPKNYLIAIDDSGQKDIRLPTERSFGLGGIALPTSRLLALRTAWMKTMEISSGAEAKVPEFVNMFGELTPQPPHVNARAVLSVFLRKFAALPVFVHAKKSEIGSALTVSTRRGGRAVDVGNLYYCLILQLTVFAMKKKNVRLKVVSDRLSCSTEEMEMQEGWRSTLDKLQLEKVDGADRIGDLTFLDSKQYPEIQIAGVLMALLFQSSEARQPLSSGMSARLTEAATNTLSSFHLK